MVRISPTLQVLGGPCDPDRVVYELLPAKPLPKLDLSISIASRFLSRPMLNRVHRFVRERRIIQRSCFLAVVLLTAMPLTPALVGRPLAILALILWVPAAVASFALLRYDVARLLLTSFDFWFSTFAIAATSVVYCALFHDARAMALLAGWSGLQTNMMIDANIRAVRLWVILTIFAALHSLESWAAISLGAIDEMHDFVIVKFASHELLASKLVSSGVLTTFAILSRNLYRKRAVFQKAVNKAIIECACFRVNLQLYAVAIRSPVSPIASLLYPVVVSSGANGRPEYKKSMQYVKQVGEIDAASVTLSPAASRLVNALLRRFSTAFQLLGFLSAALCVVDISVITFGRAIDGASSLALDAVTLASTALYTQVFGTQYQRVLMRALLTSFDFFFLSTQLALAHVFVCDFFRWRTGCVARSLTSWLWVQWVLCLDAVTPAARLKLGLRKRFVVVVLVLFIGSSTSVVYWLLLGEDAGDVFDRVIWERHTLGVDAELRAMPLFFSSCSNVAAMLLRLAWRAAVNPSDVLLVLDGLVVYENYLRTATNRYSRRWGSVGLGSNLAKRLRPRLHTKVAVRASIPTVVRENLQTQ
ncbi:hypothetical protein PybrP1_003164 [[Pythium] brassicae (nom. inval.)]|nr:hypothetical protein PybrP1_003164 [[Pythium] brassicae (nom. inval.)]